VWKNRIVSFVIGLALGILGTAGAVLVGQSGPTGDLSVRNEFVQRETAATVERLERTIKEQRERIDDLQAGNHRLTEYIGDARAVSSELAVSVTAGAEDIRSAIALLKTIKDQVYRLNGVLNRGDTGGDSGDSMDNLEDL
jgi:hypothetical protein